MLCISDVFLHFLRKVYGFFQDKDKCDLILNVLIPTLKTNKQVRYMKCLKYFVFFMVHTLKSNVCSMLRVHLSLYWAHSMCLVVYVHVASGYYKG